MAILGLLGPSRDQLAGRSGFKGRFCSCPSPFWALNTLKNQRLLTFFGIFSGLPGTVLGSSWSHLGGRLSWGHLWASCGRLGASWAFPDPPVLPHWSNLGVILGPSSGLLRPSWASCGLLRPLGLIPGPSSAQCRHASFDTIFSRWPGPRLIFWCVFVFFMKTHGVSGKNGIK